MMPNHKLCPMIVKEGIDAWVQHAVLPGGFLCAVLANDLKESFARADENNIAAMAHVVAYLYWKAPAVCWGTKDNIKEWSEIGGLDGMQKLQESNDGH